MAKLRRIARDLRQSDVAYLATQWLQSKGYRVKIQVADVSFLEHDWKIHARRKQAIMTILGLDEAST
ncbi:MAG: hypothetical protein HQ475_11160 [SAR202 cluster bacterium]|nr:hypothetical protein [SAR202 cluster bacterium]